MVQAEQDFARGSLKTTEANAALVKKKAIWSEEQWFSHWQTTRACSAYNTEFDHVSHKMGEEEPLEQLKGVLASLTPRLNGMTSSPSTRMHTRPRRLRYGQRLQEHEEDDNDEDKKAEASKAANVDAASDLFPSS